MSTSRHYTAEGIVLKRKNYGEADRFITVFTKEFGKIRVLAKGIRRVTSRRAGHVELFRYVHLSLYRSRTIDHIQEAVSISKLHTNKRDHTISETLYSYYMCELVDSLTAEYQAHRDIFDLLISSLEQLQTSSNRRLNKAIAYRFSLELLHLLGYLPKTATIQESGIAPFVEHITERKLRTPAILTALKATQ